MCNLFNGVIRSYAEYPVFWKYWLYYVNPITWWIRGTLSAVLPSVQVQCAPQEVTYFTAPEGQTCQSYAGEWVKSVAGTGYLLPGNSAGSNSAGGNECGYCMYSNGSEYMHTLNVHNDDKWHCFGIFLAFVIINWLLVYFFIYTVRIRGWTFGMSWLFGGVGVVLGGLKRLIRRE